MKYWLAFLRYGEKFRMQRRMMQQTFNSQAVKAFREPLQKRVLTLLGNVLEDESSYIDENGRYVPAVVFRLVCT